jgi:DNA-directed RNA polymerase beta' subunit
MTNMIYNIKEIQIQKIKTPFARIVIKNEIKVHEDVEYYEKTYESVSEKQVSKYDLVKLSQ